MPPKIDFAKCNLCGICDEVCPGDVLHVAFGKEGLVRYPLECSHCDVCRIECPEDAITLVFPREMLQAGSGWRAAAQVRRGSV
jgi:adenylylsulfate reductase, subunit B